MLQTLSLCTSQTSTLVSYKTSECDSVVCAVVPILPEATVFGVLHVQ